jgi:hypothetical protein
MTTQLGILSVLRLSFLKRSLEPRQFTLPTDKASYMAIRPTGQLIRVLSGRAWITFDGDDILLEPGKQMLLPRNRFAAIISTIGSETLTFEISRNCGK